MKSPERRTYTMRQRRTSVDETRARILDAAIDLYETVGVSGTSISSVAERSGVTRATVYRHFATDTDLAGAVIDEWTASAPTIDAAAVAAKPDAAARMRDALVDLYGWYRATEAIAANLLRDAHLLPAERQPELRAAAGRVRDAVTAAALPAAAGPLGTAVLNHAVAFETWRSLSEEGLDEAAIAELMEQFIATAVAAGANGSGAAARRARTARAVPRGRQARASTAATATARPVVAPAPTPAADEAVATAGVRKKPKSGKAEKAEKAVTVAKGKAKGKKGKGDRKARDRDANAR